jgi:hypothetical protein
MVSSSGSGSGSDGSAIISAIIITSDNSGV